MAMNDEDENEAVAKALVAKLEGGESAEDVAKKAIEAVDEVRKEKARKLAADIKLGTG